MNWVPDGGQVIVLLGIGGLSYVARMLVKIDRLLGRVDERLKDHDRRLGQMDTDARQPVARPVDIQ